jgi:hypothetical protein
MSVTVLFEAEIVGVECDAPEVESELVQAVQDVIGHTGAVVSDILYYTKEDES